MVVEIQHRNTGGDPMSRRIHMWWVEENHNKTKIDRGSLMTLKSGEERRKRGRRIASSPQSEKDSRVFFGREGTKVSGAFKLQINNICLV